MLQNIDHHNTIYLARGDDCSVCGRPVCRDKHRETDPSIRVDGLRGYAGKTAGGAPTSDVDAQASTGSGGRPGGSAVTVGRKSEAQPTTGVVFPDGTSRHRNPGGWLNKRETLFTSREIEGSNVRSGSKDGSSPKQVAPGW